MANKYALEAEIKAWCLSVGVTFNNLSKGFDMLTLDAKIRILDGFQKQISLARRKIIMAANLNNPPGDNNGTPPRPS